MKNSKQSLPPRWHDPFPSAFAWLRYQLTWKGRRVQLPRGEPPPIGNSALAASWKIHRCADNAQCRSPIGGGCARGWCSHFGVKPDAVGVPRLPVSIRLPKRTRVEPEAIPQNSTI